MLDVRNIRADNPSFPPMYPPITGHSWGKTGSEAPISEEDLGGPRQFLTVCLQPPYRISCPSDVNLKTVLEKHRIEGEQRNIILLLEDREASLMNLKILGFDVQSQ